MLFPADTLNLYFVHQCFKVLKHAQIWQLQNFYQLLFSTRSLSAQTHFLLLTNPLVKVWDELTLMEQFIQTLDKFMQYCRKASSYFC